MENVRAEIKIQSVEYLRVTTITSKTKTITYTDDELDEPAEVEVTIPLKKSVIKIQAVFVVDQDLQVGGDYMDNNHHSYRATDRRNLAANNIRCSHYDLPKEFILYQTKYQENGTINTMQN